ncbi:MAG: hypothetical protein JO370_15715 [Paucibacter sp.]|nr:hypothetical protein [Roseateles sp.]
MSVSGQLSLWVKWFGEGKWFVWVRDPQSWIGVIAVITAMGFCAGVFDASSPASLESSAQVARAVSTHSGA